jgi:hypothetical protein
MQLLPGRVAESKSLHGATRCRLLAGASAGERADRVVPRNWSLMFPNSSSACLYGRMTTNIAGEDQAEHIPWRTNYGGLLILGWLLEDLNAHLRARSGRGIAARHMAG